jgi:hypothetical protein
MNTRTSFSQTSGLSLSLSLSLMLRPTVIRPVCLGTKHPSGAYNQILLLSDSCEFVDVGRALWREDGSVVYNCCRSSPAQSFSGPSPVGLSTIFYCLRFDTSVFSRLLRLRRRYLTTPSHGITSGLIWVSCYITSGRTTRENVFQSPIPGNVSLSPSDGLFPRLSPRKRVYRAVA